MRGFGILRALPAREALPWRGAGRSWSVLNAGVTLLTNTANKSALPVISFAANATHGVSSASARKWSNISIKNMCRTVHQDAVRQVATRESLGAAAEVDGAAAEANRRARVELAAAYRILEQLGLNEGVCNHLTLMAPARDGSGAEVMLVIPYGMHWSEVTASCLLGTNADGEVVEGEGEAERSAVCIHQGVRTTHNHRCVLHGHPPYATALACLKDNRLTMTHQNAMRFYDKIAYDRSFERTGDTKQEGRRLGSVLGDKEVLLMGNHGILVTGSSVAMAFDAMYYLERLAMFQILAISTGRELREIPEESCREFSEEYSSERLCREYSVPHFDSVLRRLRRDCPEFAL